jgi:AraC-like DNA-binding protein
MEYFSWLKIEAAKKLIRENRYNYSQIANLLGYSSYQYFSLQFKNYTRMTPSQYHRSIKSFSE